MSAHAYYGDLFNMRTVHPRLGFQRSLFREDYVQREQLGLGLADVEFFRQTVPRLEKERRPFMAFLITLSTHHDWRLPEKYQTLNVGELKGTLVGQYLQSMNHFDTGFGELLDSLQHDGLLDQSILVIYGDHKGQFGKGEPEGRIDLGRLLTRNAGWAPPDSGFDYRYWQVQNQVPLILHLPHDEAAGPRSITSGHLDIAPTLLNLLGIEKHYMVSLGRDLTQGEDEFVVFRNGTFAYADTLCVTPNASVRTAKCRDTRTGAILDPARFAARFDQARERLAASDAIITGNLIPAR
jgi:phosphoglycerol transferase MdoB-like AlkP superfamily enzyme